MAFHCLPKCIESGYLHKPDLSRSLFTMAKSISRNAINSALKYQDCDVHENINESSSDTRNRNSYENHGESLRNNHYESFNKKVSVVMRSAFNSDKMWNEHFLLLNCGISRT